MPLGIACRSVDAPLPWRLVDERRAIRAEVEESRGAKKEVDRTRKSRVALDKEEHSPGISAVGTAIADPRGGIYAISIPMPTSRFASSRANVAKLLLKVRSTLTELFGT